MEEFLNSSLAPEVGVSWQMLVTMLLTSFVLSQMIAAVYTWTFRGLSYSRGYVISLALTGLVATVLMLAIGNNVARGLGLLGTLAIIRFRSTMRDVRDMIFIFASLAVGIAVGVQALAVATLGAVAFCLFSVHLTLSPFASRRQFDGLLRLNTPADSGCDALLKRVLRDHCSNFVLVNLREVSQGERLDQAYQVKLREPTYQEHLVTAIGTLAEVSDISLLMQDPSLEV
jgi:uncharacterized membrane protein YhiD involved in acid resistance